MSYLRRLSIDFGAGEVRMKKIPEYSRFCEWESEIYLNNIINMNQNEQELEDEYASDRVPLGQTFTILCV